MKIEELIDRGDETGQRIPQRCRFCLRLSGDAESILERITERKRFVHREVV